MDHIGQFFVVGLSAHLSVHLSVRHTLKRAVLFQHTIHMFLGTLPFALAKIEICPLFFYLEAYICILPKYFIASKICLPIIINRDYVS